MARCTVGAYLTIKLIYVNRSSTKPGHFQMEIETKLKTRKFYHISGLMSAFQPNKRRRKFSYQLLSFLDITFI